MGLLVLFLGLWLLAVGMASWQSRCRYRERSQTWRVARAATGVVATVIVSLVPAFAFGGTVSFTVTVPRGSHHDDVAVGASESLDVRDNVRIELIKNGVTVAGRATNVGTGLAEIGVSTKIGTVDSNGNVTLRGSKISRDVHVGGVLTRQQGATVDGHTFAGKFETTSTSWQVDFPNLVAPVPSGSVTLNPGAYGAAALAANQTVTLKPGKYTFSSFRMEPQSKLILDNGGGEIFIYVQSQEVALRGTIQRNAPAKYNVLWGYAGTVRFTIEKGFDGHVVAPYATLALSNPVQQFKGSFWGKRVEVSANVLVQHVPFVRTSCSSAEADCRREWGCSLVDSDLDSVPDCTEERDGEPWTSVNVGNGITSELYPACHNVSSQLCNQLVQFSEVQACLDDRLDTTFSPDVWSFDPATPALCPVDFGFDSNALACAQGMLVWSGGYVKLQAGKHCFGVAGFSSRTPPVQEACTALFFDTPTLGRIPQQGTTCFNVAEGVYPIGWAFEGYPSRLGEPAITHCFGGNANCVPTGVLRPELLRPQACGIVEPCSEDCPCESNAECESDQDCAPGEACPDSPNGALYGRWPSLRLCVDVTCASGGASCIPGNLDAPSPCESDNECGTGYHCSAVGLAFGDLPDARYCWHDVCTGSDADLYCGHTDALCGACLCNATCSGKACGDDPSDGCGGYCEGLCANGETGCTRDFDCVGDAVCDAGRCLPPSCYSDSCDPATCGAVCVSACRRECADRECGEDTGCGVSCGTCDDGETCVSGRCLVGEETLPEIPEPIQNDLPTSAVGTLGGSLSVSSAGTPVYILPIELPPGVGGTRPSVNLAYSGSTRTENAGIGWSIGVTSSITRCSKTMAVDGVSEGPLGLVSDAFCLDGQRLILVSGVAGTDGAEYRTEIESFRRALFIPKGGGLDGDPDHWEVHDRDGTVRHYGRAGVIPETDFEVSSHWMLTSEINRSGVVARYFYAKTEHQTECEVPSESDFGDVSSDWSGPHWGRAAARNCVAMDASLLTQIAYGGDERGFGAHRVEFEYEASGETVSLHATTGTQRFGTKRLSGVAVKYGDELIRRYQMSYQSVAGRKNLLSAVSVCGVEPDGSEVCLPKSSFTYYGEAGQETAPNPFVAEPIDDRLSYSPIDQRFWIDANGDGLKDLLFLGDGEVDGWFVALGVYSDDEVVSEPEYAGTTSKCFGPAGLFDLNGDGMTDLLESCPKNGSLLAWFATGDAEDPYEQELLAEGFDDTSQVFLADFEGTGYPNIVECQGRNVRVHSFEGDFQYQVELPGASTCSWNANAERKYPVPMLLDLDRDGAVRLFVRDQMAEGTAYGLNPVTHEWESMGYLSFQSEASTTGYRPGYGAIKILDSNGDGLAELVEHNGLAVTVSKTPGRCDEYGCVEPTPEVTYSQTGATVAWRNRGLHGWELNTVHPKDANGSVTSFDRTAFDMLSVLDHDRNGSEELVGFAQGSGSSFELRVVGETVPGDWRVKTIPNFAVNKKYVKPEAPPAFGDLNGDGVADLVLFDGKDIRLHLGADPQRYFLKEVKDGLGNRVKVTYDATGDRYTKGECRLDAICVPRAGAVVADIEYLDANATRTQLMSHRYRDAQRGRYGRGWLGYAERETVETDGDGKPIKTIRAVFDNGSKPADPSDPEGDRVTTFDNEHKAYFYAGVPLRVDQISPEVDSGFSSGPGGSVRAVFVSRTLLTPTTRMSDANRPFVIPATTNRKLLQRIGDEPELELSSENESYGDEVPTIDQYGNVLKRYIARTIGGTSEVESISNQFHSPAQSGGYVNLLKHQVRESSRGGSVKRTITDFEYDSVGRLSYVTDEPGDSERELSTHYVYDQFGNVTIEQRFSHDLSIFRETVYGYDSSGLRLNRLTNPLGMSWLYNLGPATGATLVEVDPNGVATRHAYDAFGRATRSEGATGVMTTQVASTTDHAAAYRVTTMSSDAVSSRGSIAYFDSVGRNLLTHATGIGGSIVEQSFVYDGRGRLKSTTVPHPAGATGALTTTYAYDEVGLIRSVTSPDATGELGETRFEYATRFTGEEYADEEHGPFAFVTRQIDVDGVEALAFGDELGLVTRAERGEELQKLVYDGNGDVVTHVTNSNRHEYVRDNHGRVEQTKDRDIGQVEFDYDAVGQLRSVTQADGSITSYVYDAIGRVTDVLGAGSTTSYTYDRDVVGESEGESPVQNALGQLVRVEHLERGEQTTQRLRYLASTGDPLTNRSFIEEAQLKTRGVTLQTRYEYLPGTAKLSVQHYPSRFGMPFAVQQCYDTSGGVSHVVAAQAGGATANDCATANGSDVYWRRGTVLNGVVPVSAEYGNGVIVSQDINAANYALEGITVNATNGDLTLGYGYKASGRLSSESRASTFGASIPVPNRATAFERGYDYAASGVLESVHDTANDEVVYDPEFTSQLRLNSLKGAGGATLAGPYTYYPAAGGGTTNRPSDIGDNHFEYDGRGNQTRRQGPDVAGSLQVIEYTDRNLPWRVFTASGPDVDIVEFAYDGQGTRVYTAAADAETWHLGSAYEYERSTEGWENLPASEEERFSIYAEGRIVAQRTFRYGLGLPQGNSTQYLHADRQGSVVAVSDDEGAVTAELSYGLYGEPEQPMPVRFGYTGHRHETALGLVDARGRFYDPKFGFFLSPDPIGPRSGGSLRGNRYAYVGYDPINYIDPTGYFWKEVASFAGGIVAGVVCTIVTVNPGVGVACGAAAGAAIAGIWTAAEGGSAREVLDSVIIGGALGAVGGGIGALAVIGGAALLGGGGGAWGLGEAGAGVAASGVVHPASEGFRYDEYGFSETYGEVNGAQPGYAAPPPPQRAPTAAKNDAKVRGAATQARGYSSPSEAAIHALERYNPASIQSKGESVLDTGTEYGGLIYQLQGAFYFTPAVLGTNGEDDRAVVNIWDALKHLPDGAKVVGDYHTHGGSPSPALLDALSAGDPVNGADTGEVFSGMENHLHLRDPSKFSVKLREYFAKTDIGGARLDLTKYAIYIDSTVPFTSFLATPLGRLGVHIVTTGEVFFFSPNRRFLPRAK